MPLPNPRLQKVPPSQLTLDSFWLERIRYDESDEREEEPCLPTARASRPQILVDPDNDSNFIVRMRVEVACGAQRTVDVTAVGLFQIESTDGGDVEALRRLNAPVMLLGSIRGMLASITGLTRSGRLDIPSLNVSNLLE